MPNRHMIVVVVAAILPCTTTTRAALAAPFQAGDVTTCTQGDWG